MRREKRNKTHRFSYSTGKRSFDRWIFLLAVVLASLGLVAIADASAPQAQAFFSDSFYFVKQQMVWAILGLIALFVGLVVPYRFWKKVAIYIFVANIVLLIAVLIPQFGVKALGARRWISLGFFSFQPSEMVKLSLVMFLAALGDSQKSYKYMFFSVLVVSGLIMLQPDLGTTLVISLIGFAQIFVAGVPLLVLGSTALAGVILSFLLIVISPYRRERLSTFLESSSDPLGSAYHIRQILIALGSGGLFGVGLGQGKQKYLFLPESATDSLFAVIAEEIGFVGCLVLIAIFTFFIYRIIRVALLVGDRFGSLLAVGIASWIGGQMFLNISSMIALTPLTGIPLPFFSYGGSSLTMVLFAVGIVLNISRYSLRKSVRS